MSKNTITLNPEYIILHEGNNTHVYGFDVDHPAVWAEVERKTGSTKLELMKRASDAYSESVSDEEWLAAPMTAWERHWCEGGAEDEDEDDDGLAKALLEALTEPPTPED